MWLGWSDWAGVVASVGCAIHCAAMPFAIAYLPALGLSFLAGDAFHKWMAVACFAIALTAFIPGLRKHGRLTPVLIGTTGLVLIAVAAFGFASDCCTTCTGEATTVAATESRDDGEACCPLCVAEDSKTSITSESEAILPGANLTPPAATASLQMIAPWLTPFGGLILVSAHLLNRRYDGLSGCCDGNMPKSQK